jgi:thioesterase domain-containing protein
MINLDTIEPLAKLGIEWVSGDATQTCFRIPLQGNRNDKGTLFAGSQYTALVVTGWYHTCNWATQKGLSEQVAIKDSRISYPKAARSDLSVQARFLEPPDLRPSGHWRAKVEVEAFDGAGDVVARLTGDYRVLMPASE